MNNTSVSSYVLCDSPSPSDDDDDDDDGDGDGDGDEDAGDVADYDDVVSNNMRSTNKRGPLAG